MSWHLFKSWRHGQHLYIADWTRASALVVSCVCFLYINSTTELHHEILREHLLISFIPTLSWSVGMLHSAFPSKGAMATTPSFAGSMDNVTSCDSYGLAKDERVETKRMGSQDEIKILICKNQELERTEMEGWFREAKLCKRNGFCSAWKCIFNPKNHGRTARNRSCHPLPKHHRATSIEQSRPNQPVDFNVRSTSISAGFSSFPLRCFSINVSSVDPHPSNICLAEANHILAHVQLALLTCTCPEGSYNSDTLKEINNVWSISMKQRLKSNTSNRVFS